MFHLSDLFQDLGLGWVGEIVPILVQSSVQRVPFHFTAFKREESQADYLWGCQQRQTFDCVACYRNSKVGGLGGLEVEPLSVTQTHLCTQHTCTQTLRIRTFIHIYKCTMTDLRQ